MTGSFILTHPVTMVFGLTISLLTGYPAVDSSGTLVNSPPVTGSCIVTIVSTAFAIASGNNYRYRCR